MPKMTRDNRQEKEIKQKWRIKKKIKTTLNQICFGKMPRNGIDKILQAFSIEAQKIFLNKSNILNC